VQRSRCGQVGDPEYAPRRLIGASTAPQSRAPPSKSLENRDLYGWGCGGLDNTALRFYVSKVIKFSHPPIEEWQDARTAQ
jgi:hypothetical protein